MSVAAHKWNVGWDALTAGMYKTERVLSLTTVEPSVHPVRGIGRIFTAQAALGPLCMGKGLVDILTAHYGHVAGGYLFATWAARMVLATCSKDALYSVVGHLGGPSLWSPPLMAYASTTSRHYPDREGTVVRQAVAGWCDDVYAGVGTKRQLDTPELVRGPASLLPGWPSVVVGGDCCVSRGVPPAGAFDRKGRYTIREVVARTNRELMLATLTLAVEATRVYLEMSAPEYGPRRVPTVLAGLADKWPWPAGYVPCNLEQFDQVLHGSETSTDPVSEVLLTAVWPAFFHENGVPRTTLPLFL